MFRPSRSVPIIGAALPTCASTSTTCEPLLVSAYVNGFPPSVPAQLIEYTFAAAQGPPLNPVLSINLQTVNFNISAVDQVYLPAAIGAAATGRPQNTYLGSTQALAPFRAELQAFTAGGTLWPNYVPAYYTAQAPTIPLPQPPAGAQPYPEPQLPSTNTVYAESFRNPPPAPPVLSSDTLTGIGVLGQVAQGTLDLWNKCTSQTPVQSPTCTRIRQINTFFVNDYRQCFPNQPLPGTTDFLRTVYGWVQFPGCATPLSQVAGYDAGDRHLLQPAVQLLRPHVLPADVFNPYVKLIHQTLASNAYGFSIDDAVAFKSLPGTGIVITIAGVNGLENQTQTPLPTATTYETYCRGGGVGLGAPPPGNDFLAQLLRSFTIDVRLPAKPDWGIGRVKSVSGALVTVRFLHRGTVTVDTRSAKLSIVRVKPVKANWPKPY